MNSFDTTDRGGRIPVKDDTEDTAGHGFRMGVADDGSFRLNAGSPAGEDETEGHTFKMHLTDEAEAADAEGHAFSRGVVDEDQDDAEGHGHRMF